MLDELNRVRPEAETPPNSASNEARENLREQVAQFATRMRHAGHVESAHFLEVAALALRDPDHR
ncbi:MAG: hypothetical protein QGI63_09525 [Rhodospirillales bacterium]|nr:hypothetical protein [Rhodospirillales bacterium]